MKLRNKKTGEIHNITDIRLLSDNMEKNFVFFSQTEGHNYAYKTLAELNEEWEDYKETKEYWAIDCFSTDGDIVSQFTGGSGIVLENRKSIGNYFETEGEAKKTVEKLKAWERLKDRGFRITGWNTNMRELYFDVPDTFFPHKNCITSETWDDLDLLFGGDDE